MSAKVPWRRLLFGRSSAMGLNRRNLELILPNNPRWAYPIADDKVRAKKVLREAGVAVAPTLGLIGSLHDVGRIVDIAANHPELVMKPCNGRAGRGVLVITRGENGEMRTPSGRVLTNENLERHAADIVFGVYSLDRADRALVEPRLVPAAFFAELCPTALGDIRVILLKGRPLMSMMRVPTEQSDGRANLHQGAMGIAVDIASGRAFRAWHEGRPITVHPDTGAPVVDITVPHWDGIIDLAKRTAAAVPLDYIGVDIVVDRTLGPLLLELNVRPGLEIQNVNGKSLVRCLEEVGA